PPPRGVHTHTPSSAPSSPPPLSPTLPPSAPLFRSGLTATATGPTAVDLSWNSSSGATTYKLERSTSATSGFNQISWNSPTTYTDNRHNPRLNTTHYYSARANNSSSDTAYSAVVSVT